MKAKGEGADGRKKDVEYWVINNKIWIILRD